MRERSVINVIAFILNGVSILNNYLFDGLMAFIKKQNERNKSN